jgi:hypothetical protein
VTGRGLQGREIAQQMLLIPVVIAGLVVLLVIAQPHYMGGGDFNPFDAWISWVGIVSYLVGFGWMIRIYRSTLDAEARRSSWRSRSR